MSEREDGAKPSDVSSNGQHTLELESTKEQDEVEDAVEQHKAKNRVEQDKAKDPVEQSIRDRPTYASFGNEGTTASVNAFGRLMQMSQFLGHGNSGIYCVDCRTTAEPYLVELRAQQLDDLIKNPNDGFGLTAKDTRGNLWQYSDTRPTLEFQNDRWPRFVFHDKENSSQPKDAGHPLTIQYFCDGGTIFQHYSWNVPSKTRDSVPTFVFDYELLIRDLDFVEGAYHANECTWDDDSREAFTTSEVHDYYDSRYWVLSPKHKTSLIIGHKIMVTELKKNEEEQQENEEENQDIEEEPIVCLIVSAFVNGVPQSIKISDPNACLCEIDLTKEVCNSCKEGGTLEVTITYRLQTILKYDDLEKVRVSTRNFDDFSKKRGDSETRILFSSHQHLDRIIRRNLEHILSVCSIPVLFSTTDRTRRYTWPKSTDSSKEGRDILVKDKDLALPNFTSPSTTVDPAACSTAEPTRRHTWHRDILVKDKDPPIALTCGDMAGHRVAQLSSLSYAFQFLVSMAGCVKSAQDKPRNYLFPSQTCTCGGKEPICGVCTAVKNASSRLHYRILRVLRGHFRWICESAETPDKGGYSKYYWPTGKRIFSWKYTSLIATPVQLLKAQSLVDVDPDSRKRIHRILEIFTSWIQTIDKSNARGKCVFSRRYMSPKYRLSDHVWICWALQARESLGSIDYREFEELNHKDYSFSYISKAVIKRFTCENSVTKQRMLATRRGPDETRFLLHSKDTVLLYAYEDSIFKPEKKKHREEKDVKKFKREVLSKWNNLLDAQLHHMEQTDMNWDKPLWYGMAILLSSQKKRINNWAPDRTFTTLSNTLFSSSSLNGLFPGLLDEDRQPIALQDEDDVEDYWHTTFEIPFILWSYAKSQLEKLPKGSEGESNGFRAEKVNKDVATSSAQASKTTSFSSFGKLVDQKVLVDISDDWLQEEPAMLKFGYIPQGADEPTPIVNHETEGLIIDVQRGVWQGSKIWTTRLTTGAELRETLQHPRTAANAKKRIIWLPGRTKNKATRSACTLASPIPEQENMEVFFERHAHHEKYFSDSTSAALNAWETELHLSFFRLDEGEDMESRKMSRVSKGFRFAGDFFDRYWTCHFVENEITAKELILEDSSQGADETQDSQSADQLEDQSNDQRDGAERNVDQRVGELTPDNLGERLSKLNHDDTDRAVKCPWQQRKILELLLFNEILGALKDSTDRIWTSTRKRVLRLGDLKSPPGIQGQSELSSYNSNVTLIGGPQDRMTKVVSDEISFTESEDPIAKVVSDEITFIRWANRENYLDLAQLWRPEEPFLQALEDDLAANLEKIREWDRREQDRQYERPRWTRAKEVTFRHTITKLVVCNNRTVRDIERLQSNIKTFRTSLNSRLSSIRDDLGFDTANKSYETGDNLAVFTYVTVVFLPLSFATSIYSMTQAPSGVIVGYMVVTASIALSLTVFALANSNDLNIVLVAPLFARAKRIGRPLTVLLLFLLYGVWFALLPLRLVVRQIFNIVHKATVRKVGGSDSPSEGVAGRDVVKDWKQWLKDRNRGFDPKKWLKGDEQESDPKRCRGKKQKEDEETLRWRGRRQKEDEETLI